MLNALLIQLFGREVILALGGGEASTTGEMAP